jgi:hypothetical protein
MFLRSKFDSMPIKLLVDRDVVDDDEVLLVRMVSCGG